MFLLDTNVVSETRRPRPHGAVMHWIRGVSPESLYLSAVTLGELQAGVENVRGMDSSRAAELEAWVDGLANAYRVVPMDGRAFRLLARLMHRKSRHLLDDAMIAATAIENDMIVVTRSVTDFKPFGVRTLDPFAA